MKVLFATTNPAKIERYTKKLKEKGIEILTLKDINIKLDINENGKNALENAYIKARTYYDETKIITIAEDTNLFIEELPEEKQPGTHIKRINGKELTDEEAIEYYVDLVKNNGGKLTAKWVYGMVIYNGKKAEQYTWSKSHFYFVDKPCEKRNAGYPLDSITIVPEYNKYLVELSKEEKEDYRNNNSEENVIQFIIKAIEDIKE